MMKHLKANLLVKKAILKSTLLMLSSVALTVASAQSAIAGTTTVTDAIGTQEIWTYNENLGVERLTSRINQIDSKGITQTFDANNNLLSRTDAEGRITTYTYNATNQKTSMTEASGTSEARTTTYTYVSPDIDLVVTKTSPSVHTGSNKTVTYTYDTDLNITQITINGFTQTGTPVSRTTTFQYNSSGQVTQTDGPRTDISDITTFAYYSCSTGAHCGQLASSTNAAGHIISYDSYDANARITQMTDALGVVTTYTYHPRGWLLSITRTPPQGAARTTSYQYDAVGQLTQTTLPDGIILSYTYDEAHDLRSISDNLGNLVEYTYDAKGNRTNTQTRDPDNTLVRELTTQYDIRNFIASINAAGSITQQVNDAVGNNTQTTDPNQNPSTGHSYDPLDRLTSTLDALSNTTSYNYNVADQLTQVTAPNGVITQYEYDDLGNRLKETSADRGNTSYVYDAAGNLTDQTDARGVTVTLTYDALNRLTQNSFPDASENITYAYDNCTNGTGRMCSMTDASGTTSYQYDSWGNITQVTKTEIKDSTTLGTYVFQYAYDAADRLVQQTNPNGLVIDYTRDAIGRVTGVAATLNSTAYTIISNRQYQADGLYTSQTWGNGLVETRQFDLQGRLTDQTLGSMGSIVFQYDANGNLLSKLNPALGDSVFSYDVLDRVDAETGALGTWGFSYDGNGNLLTQTDNGQTFSHIYNAGSNQLTNVASYQQTVDAAGNTTSDFSGGRNFVYNDRNQLGQFTNADGTVTVGYEYDARNLRSRKEIDITGPDPSSFVLNYQYDLNGQLTQRYYEGFALLESYIWLDGEPVAKFGTDPNTGNPKILYLVTDHLMTPRLGLDQTGQITWAWLSDAYGRAAAIPDIDGDGNFEEVHLRFPGQYFDVETGLHYNWHRYYEPRIGRYITSDPIGLDGGLNTFAYANGNPTIEVDPLGLASFIGFPQGKEGKAKAALDEAIKKIEECEEGMCIHDPFFKPGDKDRLINRLKNARFVYVPTLQHCGVVYPTPFSNTIRVGPKTFDFGKCCDLSSTFAHEASHLNFTRENKAQELEKRCFNCPR